MKMSLSSSLFARRTAGAVLACAAAVFAATATAADNYPSRPIKIIVPFAAGGGSDVTARLIGRKLQEVYGQAVVIENQPGASTQIATRNVIRSAPDGYTLLLATTSVVNNAHLYPRLDYDAMKELVPVVGIVDVPPFLAVGPGIKATNVKDFITEIKAKAATEKGVTFGSAGPGSTLHLASEWLVKQLGIKAVHSPYKGSGPASVALAQGDIDFSFDNIPPLRPMVDAGKVRLLMVGARNRFPSTPTLPTLKESGLPDEELSSWFILMAPAQTPPAVVASINSEVNKILKKPDVRSSLIDLGLAPMDTSVDDLKKRMRNDFNMWGGIIKDAKVTLE